jgi:energy-coupling factor transporter ATP-binding protein EcfA2
MKISKIEIKDFRAFPGPATYTFDLAGKNLLVYGENGSGKSSLFHALSEFFNLNQKAKPFSDFKNVFSEPTLADGHITVHFQGGSSGMWSFTGSRPLADTQIAERARRFRGIDYRALLKTHFAHSGDNVNLFDVAVKNLLSHYDVPTVGGKMTTIGRLWQHVIDRKPPNHRGRNVKYAKNAVDEFNAAFEPILPTLGKRVQELLGQFPNCQFDLQFSFPRVSYDEYSRKYNGTELNLNLTYNGRPIAGHQHFLNEARLSALALAFYFAGLLVSIPPPPPGTPETPKILVLDDAVIGLDMSNRMPVLEILKKYFAEWQILLLTYDKVWYEIVQLQTQGTSAWQCDELYLGEAPDGSELPVHKPQGKGWDYFLDRAKLHLAANDDRAAAVYARAAFESRIKKYCEKNSVWVKYNTDPRRIDAQSLWDGLKHKVADQIGKTPPTDPDYTKLQAIQARFAPMEVYRKIVLNPLSHSGTATVAKVEIQGAIDEIQKLGQALS